VSMANCYFAKPHGMQHCYIPFFILLISNALLVLARHRAFLCSPQDSGTSKPPKFRRSRGPWGGVQIIPGLPAIRPETSFSAYPMLFPTIALVTFSRKPTGYCFSSGLPYGQPFGNFQWLFTQNVHGPSLRDRNPALPFFGSV
jgi:hypothetical protein